MLKHCKRGLKDIPDEVIEGALSHGLRFSSKVEMYEVYDDDVLIGICGFSFNKSCVFTKNLYVLPNHRKKGYGDRILKWMIWKIKTESYSKVIKATCTPMSLPIYLKNGFKICGEYRNGNKNVFLLI